MTNNFIVSPYYKDARLLVKDASGFSHEKNIEKTVEEGAYFRKLAATLDLAREIMAITEQNTEEIKKRVDEIGRVNKRNTKKLEEMRDELIFLQENYKIVKK